MNGKTELERLQTELRTTRIELAAAEYSVSEWERKFAEFASSVLRSSEAAEAAARGMYEAMWVQDREQLIAHFQGFFSKKRVFVFPDDARWGKEQLGKLARNLSAARQERDDAMRKRLELEDTLRTYQALEPERAKDARRQLAAQFAAEKERLAQMHAAECQRLAGESRQLRETLDNQASARSDVEQRASELSIALERQKRATEKAQSRLAELDLAKERIRVLEDYITKEAERDVLRENQALHQRVSELVNAEGITSKLKGEHVSSEKGTIIFSDTNPGDVKHCTSELSRPSRISTVSKRKTTSCVRLRRE